MRVYLASMFSDKDRIKGRAAELAVLGIECTSRWADETIPHDATIKSLPEAYHRETAVADIDDILRSDKVVLTVPSPDMLADTTPNTSSRGGRHFESGFVYGLITAEVLVDGRPTRELIILGKKENVFHYLDGIGPTHRYPTIKQFETWEEVKTYLKGE